MPYSGDTFTLPANSCRPAVDGTAISSTSFNALMADLESGLTAVKTSDSDKLSVTDGGTIAAAVTMDSTLDVTGATALSSTLTVAGKSTLTGLLEANGGITVTLASGTDALVTGGNITAGIVNATGGLIGDLTGDCSGSAGSVPWSGVTGKPKYLAGVLAGTAGVATASVTFSSAFASTPVVIVTPVWVGGAEQQKHALVSTVSTTGFTVVCQCYDSSITNFKTPTGSWSVEWIAIDPA